MTPGATQKGREANRPQSGNEPPSAAGARRIGGISPASLALLAIVDRYLSVRLVRCYQRGPHAGPLRGRRMQGTVESRSDGLRFYVSFFIVAHVNRSGSGEPVGMGRR